MRSEVRTALSTVANDEPEDYDQPAQRVLDGADPIRDLFLKKHERHRRDMIDLPIPEQKRLIEPIPYDDLPKTNLCQALVMNHLQNEMDGSKHELLFTAQDFTRMGYFND